MGIRVHKAIGYGLMDLAFERRDGAATMTDPRIDWRRWHKRTRRMYDIGPKSFMAWVRRNWDDLLRLEAEERREPIERVREFSLICPMLMRDFFKRHGDWSLNDCVVHQDEHGLPNVLLLLPPTQAHRGEGGWLRFDDTIDWIEETRVHGANHRVVDLDSSGIYPYDGMWVKIRDVKPGTWPEQWRRPMTGVRSGADGLPTAMLGREYNMLVGKWDPGRIPPMAEGDLLAHLRADWRPQLPTEVLAVLWWLRDCLDFGTVRDALRPMLYVYWS